MAKKDTVVNLYLAISLGAWAPVSSDSFLPILAKLSQTYPTNAVYQEAVVSSLKGLEEDFQKIVGGSNADKSSNDLLNSVLSKTIENKRNKKENSIFVEVSVKVDRRTNGLEIYRSTCMSCHGA